MKWVTRDYLHLDRVACPWVIRRFIDPAAEFLFLPSSGNPGEPGTAHPLPAGAIPFGIPGVELGSHDENGSAVRKVVRKYGLDGDPALNRLVQLVEDAIAVFVAARGKGVVRSGALAEAAGLLFISEGLLYAAQDDLQVIAWSLPLYDGLYAACQAKLLEEGDPSLGQQTSFVLTQHVRPLLQRPPFGDWIQSVA